MMTSGGSLAPHRAVLIVWGVLTGLTAVVLMLGGGLTALQNTVIVASLPFLVIIAGLAVSFWKELPPTCRRPSGDRRGEPTDESTVQTASIDDRPPRSERRTTHVRQR